VSGIAQYGCLVRDLAATPALSEEGVDAARSQTLDSPWGHLHAVLSRDHLPAMR
jgi:hypothetical protein